MFKSRYFLYSTTTILICWGFVAMDLNIPITWHIHQQGNPQIDTLLIPFSWSAEWLIIVLPFGILLYRNWRISLIMGAIMCLQGGMVLLLKYWINAPRPIEIDPTKMRSIQHLEINHWQSFPSGHTATAFFMMGVLSMIYAKKWPKLDCIFYLFACGIGYSRIYLGQHSLIDVCMGGSIALLFWKTGMFIVERTLGNRSRTQAL